MRQFHVLFSTLFLALPVVLFALSTTASAATATHHVPRHHTLTHHVNHLAKHA